MDLQQNLIINRVRKNFGTYMMLYQLSYRLKKPDGIRTHDLPRDRRSNAPDASLKFVSCIQYTIIWIKLVSIVNLLF